jgi:hypothetical protein
VLCLRAIGIVDSSRGQSQEEEERRGIVEMSNADPINLGMKICSAKEKKEEKKGVEWVLQRKKKS